MSAIKRIIIKKSIITTPKDTIINIPIKDVPVPEIKRIIIKKKIVVSPKPIEPMVNSGPIDVAVGKNYKIISIGGEMKLIKNNLQTKPNLPIAIPNETVVSNPVAPKIKLIIKPKQVVASEVPELVKQEEIVQEEVKPVAVVEKLTIKEINKKLQSAIKTADYPNIKKLLLDGGQLSYNNFDGLESAAERGLVKVYETIYTITKISEPILSDMLECAEDYNRKKLVSLLKGYIATGNYSKVDEIIHDDDVEDDTEYDSTE
jgi:hypothetical protein